MECEIQHDIPNTLWTKVTMDLFELESKNCVIVVGYTTNYFDISLISDKKLSTVVLHTKRIFSKFGIPKIIISDNGPGFVGRALKNFSVNLDFKHVTSSPHYPQSNGLVERTIQELRKHLRKLFVMNKIHIGHTEYSYISMIKYVFIMVNLEDQRNGY